MMQFFKKMIRRFLGRIVVNEEKIWSDHAASKDPSYVRRVHIRYRPLEGIAAFYHPSFGLINISNVSLGGFLLLMDIERLARHRNEAGEIHGELIILHHRMFITIMPVNSTSLGTGCHFVHKDQTIPFFLKPFMDWMRTGASFNESGNNDNSYVEGALSITLNQGIVLVTSTEKNRSYIVAIDGNKVEFKHLAEGTRKDMVCEELMFVIIGFFTSHPFLNLSECIATLKSWIFEAEQLRKEKRSA